MSRIFSNLLVNASEKTLDPIEKSMMDIQYKDYDIWIKNFALNLNNIWNENSSRDLSKFLSNLIIQYVSYI